MKKVLFLLLLVFTLILTGCNSSSSKLELLSLENLYDKINNKESFIVYFSSEDNTFLEKKLSNVLETNNLTGYLIKTNKISEEDKIKLQPTITYEDNSIVFIIEGKDPSILSHVTNDEVTTYELTERLKDMKFIKKEA